MDRRSTTTLVVFAAKPLLGAVFLLIYAIYSWTEVHSVFVVGLAVLWLAGAATWMPAANLASGRVAH